MTEPSDAVKVTAARARWRADLLAYDAAERRRIAGDDPSPTAQAISAAADSKTAEATIHLDLAEAEEALSKAKQERDANPGDPDVQAKYARVAQALTDMRMYWRGIGEWTRTRSAVLTVDNFPEPSDEEVLASPGGEG